MRILVIRGNPRKNGHTQYITDLVVKGALEAGAEINDIDLHKKTINECIGCYDCWTQSPGKCIFRDDMDELLNLLIAADIVLCSTPLYAYNMSNSMKIFFERTLPLFKQGIVHSPDGLFRNNLRFPDKWVKKSLAFISAGALKSRDNFKGLVSIFSLLANGMYMTYSGGLIRPESYLLQFNLAKPKTVKLIETGLLQGGRELAAEGKFSEETQKKVSTPLSIDTYHFKKYSDIYWEHVISMGAEGADLEKVQYRVTTDVRILMHEMARSIDPLATARLKAVFQFDFPNKELHYCLTVNKGKCTLEEKKSESCDLRVTSDTITWAKAFVREISMKDALMQRKVKLEGDKLLFKRLERYFPPPVS